MTSSDGRGGDSDDRPSAERAQTDFEDFFEYAAVGMHSVGPDGTILLANRAELEMLGYRAGEYVGRNIAEFHEDRAVIDDVLRRLARGERILDQPGRMRRRDGTVLDVILRSTPRVEGGRFVRSRCVTTDVTQRLAAERALRASEERLETEVEAMERLHAASARLVAATDLEEALGAVLDAAMAACGAELGNVQVIDPKTGALTIAAQRGFRRDFLDHFGTVRPDDGSACARALQHGVRVVVEDVDADPAFAPHRAIAAAAGFRAVQSTPLRCGSDEIVGILSTHFRRPRRISDREARLLDLCARPAADLVARVRTESGLRDADRRKDEFLSILAHELRNRIAPMAASLGVLSRAGDEPELVGRACATMERQVRHIVRLVDDLLDVSRITLGKLELRRERFELASVVRDAVESCRPLAEQARHQLEIRLPADPVPLDGDPVRLAQVFSNLLTNACKYTRPGGRVRLAAERIDASVEIVVEDTGVGIPPHMLDKVFDLFTQVRPTSDESLSGLGIGLSLVRRLVEAHAGSVSAQSEGAGRGSRFVVRLPVAQGAPAAGAGVRVETVDTGKPPRRRVLVVDDNRDNAQSLATLLEVAGHEASVAYDGIEALARAAENPPDVILLDIGLPRIDGFEVCRRIRGLSWGRSVLVLALTGWGRDEDRRRSLDAGFDGHLVKPLDAKLLLELLASRHAGDAAGRAGAPPARA